MTLNLGHSEGLALTEKTSGSNMVGMERLLSSQAQLHWGENIGVAFFRGGERPKIDFRAFPPSGGTWGSLFPVDLICLFKEASREAVQHLSDIEIITGNPDRIQYPPVGLLMATLQGHHARLIAANHDRLASCYPAYPSVFPVKTGRQMIAYTLPDDFQSKAKKYPYYLGTYNPESKEAFIQTTGNFLVEVDCLTLANGIVIDPDKRAPIDKTDIAKSMNLAAGAKVTGFINDDTGIMVVTAEEYRSPGLITVGIPLIRPAP